MRSFDEGARTDDVRVTVSVAGGTADEGTDFSTVTDFTITIASGATSGEAAFELIPRDDPVNEADETVVVTGATGASGLPVAPALGVKVLIEDDEADPVATLVLDPGVDRRGRGGEHGERDASTVRRPGRPRSRCRRRRWTRRWRTTTC